MSRLKTIRFQALVGAAGLLAVAGGLARQASAASVSFTVDSTRSSYHIVNVADDGASPPSPLQNSTIATVPVIPQVPGAATAKLSGTINANEVGNQLTFSGTSSISLVANPAGPFSPAANPGVDSFGLITNGATVVGVISVAVRDWVFTIQSGTATDGVAASAGSLVFATTQGFQQNSFSGQQSIIGQSGLNVATGLVSLTTSGGIETLTIPVVRLPAAGTPGQLYIDGTIVATRVVPEPSTISMAGMGLLGFAFVGRRVRRKFKS